MSAELLVIRCQLGERDAFAELVRSWHGPVATYVRNMLGPADADDVVQEVWLAVVRGLPRLRDAARFTPWLFTIARRAVVDRLRVEYARAEEPLDTGGAVPAAVVTELGDAVLDRTIVLAGLSELPLLEREVLVLFYLDDLSVEACAEVCGTPVGTVKSRLFRARRMLRQELARRGCA